MRGTQLLQTVLLLLGAVSLANCHRTKCVPRPTKNFYWTRCADDVKGPIEITQVDAYQGGKTVEQNGGLDLTQPLKLSFKLKNNYNKKEINDHKFDFQPYQYSDDDGPPCDWYELEVGDAMSDVDGCSLIKTNCRYKNKPDKSEAVVDFPALLGEYASAASATLEIGSYYAFDITERDGDKKLNCVRMQAKLKKA